MATISGYTDCVLITNSFHPHIPPPGRVAWSIGYLHTWCHDRFPLSDTRCTRAAQPRAIAALVHLCKCQSQCHHIVTKCASNLGCQSISLHCHFRTRSGLLEGAPVAPGLFPNGICLNTQGMLATPSRPPRVFRAKEPLRAAGPRHALVANHASGNPARQLFQ